MSNEQATLIRGQGDTIRVREHRRPDEQLEFPCGRWNPIHRAEPRVRYVDVTSPGDREIVEAMTASVMTQSLRRHQPTGSEIIGRRTCTSILSRVLSDHRQA